MAWLAFWEQPAGAAEQAYSRPIETETGTHQPPAKALARLSQAPGAGFL